MGAVEIEPAARKNDVALADHGFVRADVCGHAGERKRFCDVDRIGSIHVGVLLELGFARDVDRRSRRAASDRATVVAETDWIVSAARAGAAA